jgi:HSP20 family protein
MLPTPMRRRAGAYDPAAVVTDEFNRLLRRIWGDRIDVEEARSGAYPVDIFEEDGTLVVNAELPGFRNEEIDVSIDNGMLRIKAERAPEEIRGERHLVERHFSRVERSFELPGEFDEDNAEAKLEGGVLQLRLPRKEGAQTKKISVE